MTYGTQGKTFVHIMCAELSTKVLMLKNFTHVIATIESTQCTSECHSNFVFLNQTDQEHTSRKNDIQTSQDKTFFT